MRGLTAEDMNFFFCVISQIKDKGTKEIEISTDEIKKIIHYEDRPNRWIKVLDSLGDKFSGLRYIEKSSKKIAYFSIFQRFVIDVEERTVSVKVSSDFEYIVNKLTKNFTMYELVEFTNLKSTYAKTMYRIIKQWRTVGKKQFDIDTFRQLLDIPKSYTSNNIQQRVIKPIQKELPQYFEDFKVKVVKADTRGTPVIGYKFTWTPEKVPKKPEFVRELENNSIEKSKNDKTLENIVQKVKRRKRDKLDEWIVENTDLIY